MTHIIFISPENRDSKIQMHELADDFYSGGTQEHYYNVDMAEIPDRYEIETEGNRLAGFIRTLKLEGNPAQIVFVAYEDYAFVVFNALFRLKLIPAGVLVVNFPLANIELALGDELGWLRDNMSKSNQAKGKMFVFQADIMMHHVSEFLFQRRIDAEMVRVQYITKEGHLNPSIFAKVKPLIK